MLIILFKKSAEIVYNSDRICKCQISWLFKLWLIVQVTFAGMDCRTAVHINISNKETFFCLFVWFFFLFLLFRYIDKKPGCWQILAIKFVLYYVVYLIRIIGIHFIDTWGVWVIIWKLNEETSRKQKNNYYLVKKRMGWIALANKKCLFWFENSTLRRNCLKREVCKKIFRASSFSVKIECVIWAVINRKDGEGKFTTLFIYHMNL